MDLGQDVRRLESGPDSRRQLYRTGWCDEAVDTESGEHAVDPARRTGRNGPASREPGQLRVAEACARKVRRVVLRAAVPCQLSTGTTPHASLSVGRLPSPLQASKRIRTSNRVEVGLIRVVKVTDVPVGRVVIGDSIRRIAWLVALVRKARLVSKGVIVDAFRQRGIGAVGITRRARPASVARSGTARAGCAWTASAATALRAELAHVLDVKLLALSYATQRHTRAAQFLTSRSESGGDFRTDSQGSKPSYLKVALE